MDFLTFSPWIYFDKDGGGGTAAEAEEPEADPAENEESEAADDEGTDPDKNERSFSQAELDQQIKARLAREKSSNKSKLDAAEAKAQAAEDELALYQDQLTAIMAERMKAVPKAIKELLDKLDPLDQWAYLTENAGEILESPETPRPLKNPASEKKGFKPGI